MTTTLTQNDIDERLIIIKLISGEVLIGLVIREDQQTLLLKDPLHMQVFKREGQRDAMAFREWIPMCCSNVHPIRKMNIITLGAPSDEAKSSYIEFIVKFGTAVSEKTVQQCTVSF